MLGQMISKAVLLVISTACVANAYIVPGGAAPLPGYTEPGPGSSYGPQQPSNPYEPNPYEPNPYEPKPGQPSYGNEIRSVNLNRIVRNERLSLRQLAGLGSAYSGSEVVAVRAYAHADQSGRAANIQLVADGRIVGQQTTAGYINIIPNQQLILGSSVRSLQLVVSGSLIIDQIQIEISRSGGGYPQPTPPPPPPQYPPQQPYPPYPPYPPQQPSQQRVDVNVYRSMVGNDRLDIGQYVNLSQYRGYAVTQVVISGSAQYQTSFVSLLVNSFNQGQVQFNGGYSQQQSIFLNQRPVIGQGADSLVLYTQGNMTIEHVTLILSY